MAVLAKSAQASPLTERSLSLVNLHTGEELQQTYWRKGQYLAPALQELNLLLRDHRADEHIAMDLQLLDLLHNLDQRLGGDRPFHIISGYRSPRTNAGLRKVSSGVAKRSLHMQGKAVDIRVPGVTLRRLKQEALALEAGGVGYYPGSDFIHLDVGRVRYWRG